MEYRKIGKWGIKVSSVGLGSWLTYGGTVDAEATAKQINDAFNMGINFFDTANVYAHGQSEIVVGKALANLNRDSYVLATKVFFPMGEGPNDRGLSRKHVFEQCHHSLKRLNTDYIDIYQCHRYDQDIPMEELVRTMDNLTRQGKILYWGVSEWPAERIEEAVLTAQKLNASPPISNQPCYNLLERSIENSVIPVSRQYGLGQVVFSPLAQGVLSGKYKPGQPLPSDSRGANEQVNVFMKGRELLSEPILKRVQEMAQIAEFLNIRPAQLALAWCLRNSDISSVIVGATKSSQIEENIKAAEIKLDSETITKLDTLFARQAMFR